MTWTVHHDLASWSVLTVAAVLLAGCGASTHASSVSVDKPIANARAVAYADAVNLRAADVPGLQPARHQPKHETAAGPFGAAMDRCEGAAARAGEIIGILSPGFRHSLLRHSDTAGLLPLQLVNSGVYFFRSKALAHQYLAVADSARFAACVKTVFSREPKTVTREGSKVAEPMFSDPHISRPPVSGRGVRAYGLRVASHSALGDSESYQDFLSFMMGDAVITLNATGDPRPFFAATERRLLALLHSRAEAHQG